MSRFLKKRVWPLALLALIMLVGFLMCYLVPMFMGETIHTSSISYSSRQIRYEGRFMEIDYSMRFDYPGSRIAVGVAGPCRLYAQLKPNAGYYALFVDGVERAQIDTHKDASERGDFFLAELDSNKHEVELLLKSEGIFCQPAFYGFWMTNGEEAGFLSLARRERRIEFIGNSITCGYGVEAANENCSFSDSTSNFLRSFAFQTAEAFDAELMVVARSGIGVYRNYADSSNGSLRPMPVVYRNVLISEENSVWDFSSLEPDLVCINLGTNDLSTPGFKWDLLDKAYRNFLAEVRSHYPNAKMMILTGCMLTDKTVLAEFQKRLDAIVADRKAEGDDKIFRHDFAPANGSLGYGADWHPSLKRQKLMADELIPIVSSLMGWETVK